MLPLLLLLHIHIFWLLLLFMFNNIWFYISIFLWRFILIYNFVFLNFLFKQTKVAGFYRDNLAPIELNSMPTVIDLTLNSAHHTIILSGFNKPLNQNRIPDNKFPLYCFLCLNWLTGHKPLPPLWLPLLSMALVLFLHLHLELLPQLLLLQLLLLRNDVISCLLNRVYLLLVLKLVLVWFYNSFRWLFCLLLRPIFHFYLSIIN